jgi:hypothetical protein
VTRRVPRSVFVVDRRGVEAQRQHASRLLWQGWDCEAVAVQTGLSLDEVRAIASTVDADEVTKATTQP